jgi:hypothetical protein
MVTPKLFEHDSNNKKFSRRNKQKVGSQFVTFFDFFGEKSYNFIALRETTENCSVIKNIAVEVFAEALFRDEPGLGLKMLLPKDWPG